METGVSLLIADAEHIASELCQLDKFEVVLCSFPALEVGACSTFAPDP
jgi:hypothetical protein